MTVTSNLRRDKGFWRSGAFLFELAFTTILVATNYRLALLYNIKEPNYAYTKVFSNIRF